MSVSEIAVAPRGLHPCPAPPLTPAGIQPAYQLAQRRRLFAASGLLVYACLLGAAAKVLSARGWGIFEIAAFACFAIACPWTVLGFANAVTGFWLLHFSRDPMAKAAPFAAAGKGGAPIICATAVVLTIRNEDAARAVSRLRILKESLDRTGYGERFTYFLMSDSDQPGIIAEEEAAAAQWQSELAPHEASRIVYRRREANSGFKAGNIRDFCDRWGADYELMLTLDADSLMQGQTIVRLVRIMEAYPKIGILQSLVTGLPAACAFARIFQFGMRHGMRSYTMGQAWWTGDCGPYWGHNALVRIKPFIDHCRLPLLSGKPPLGGHILSHDQIEAAFMRRAGYEVRVLPEECGSWEENPPTLIEFMRRDLRWCQGNLQYMKLLGQPGLHAVSRFQLAWAILMFLSIPAWPILTGLLPVLAFRAKSVSDYPAGLAGLLYVIFLIMHLSPKLAGVLGVLANGTAWHYGGRARLAAGAVIETLFSFLLTAVSTFSISIFMAGLAAGKTVRWNGQTRDAHGVSWAAGFSALWPQCCAGLAVCVPLYVISPKLFLISLPLTAGYLLAVPFAVLTAHPRLVLLLQRAALCAIPEELDPPDEIEAVGRGTSHALLAPRSSL